MGGQWDGVGTEAYRGDDEHRKWRPSQYHSCLPYAFKMDEYGETEGKHIYQENGFFDGEDCDMDSNLTTPNGRDVFQPSLLISTIPSRCMSETANWNVDSETDSFVSMGSDAEISGLEQWKRRSSRCSSKMFETGGDRESGGQ